MVIQNIFKGIQHPEMVKKWWLQKHQEKCWHCWIKTRNGVAYPGKGWSLALYSYQFMDHFDVKPLANYGLLEIPSGKLIQLLKMAIEIVDLPIDSMVIFHSYVTVYQRLLEIELIKQWEYHVDQYKYPLVI